MGSTPERTVKLINKSLKTKPIHQWYKQALTDKGCCAKEEEVSLFFIINYFLPPSFDICLLCTQKIGSRSTYQDYLPVCIVPASLGSRYMQ